MSSIVTTTACRTFLVLALAANAAAPAFAQPPEDGQGGRLSPEERLEHRLAQLTERLSLDADQQTAVREILEAANSEIEELRASSSDRGPSHHQAVGQIHRQADEQIWAILTCTQKDAYHAMELERRERRHERRGHRRHERRGYQNGQSTED